MVLSVSMAKRPAIKEEEEESSSSSKSPEPLKRPPVKKAKRAETRKCPVCDEMIPIRLLPAHSELEAERVENIIKGIGSSKVTVDDLVQGTRISAVRARKSLSALNARSTSLDTLAQANKIIEKIRRNRKQRQAKLREIAKEGEETSSSNICDRDNITEGVSCPVCLQNLCGDQDVIEGHIDACLAHESQRLAEEAARDMERERNATLSRDEEYGERIGNVPGIRGTGFYLRNPDEQDVEDEVDIDGDDEVVFGDVQFTERDILPPLGGLSQVNQESIEVDIDDDADSLRDLIAQGKAARRISDSTLATRLEVADAKEGDPLDGTILAARECGDSASLITALENKIKHFSTKVTSPAAVLCRICLDPYSEPTVSTGCWHTCCRECWLRCLGTTKLCPICKRITVATDLRRIYL